MAATEEARPDWDLPRKRAGGLDRWTMTRRLQELRKKLKGRGDVEQDERLIAFAYAIWGSDAARILVELDQLGPEGVKKLVGTMVFSGQRKPIPTGIAEELRRGGFGDRC